MGNRIEIATLVVLLVALASPFALGAQPADSEAVLGARVPALIVGHGATTRHLDELQRRDRLADVADVADAVLIDVALVGIRDVDAVVPQAGRMISSLQ